MRSIKIFAGLVIILAIAVSGTYYWFGDKAEKQYKAILKNAEEEMFQFDFKNREYKRGIFNSKMKTVVDIPGPSPSSPALSFVMKHNLHHGPLPGLQPFRGEWNVTPMLGRVDTDIRWNESGGANIPKPAAMVLKEVVLRDVTLIQMDGRTESSFDIPPFNILTSAGEEDVNINWKGLRGKMTGDPELKRYRGGAKSAGMEILGLTGEFAIDSLDMNLDMHESPSGLFVGKSSFSIGKIMVKESGMGVEKALEMTDLSALSSSMEKARSISSSISMKAGKILVPGGDTWESSLEMEVRNIDAAAVLKLKETMRRLKAKQSAGGGVANPLSAITEQLPGLLKGSPEFEIGSFELMRGHDDLKGRMKIAFDGSMAAAVKNPLLLLGAITAEADISATTALSEYIARLFMKKRLLSEKGMAGRGSEDEEIDEMASAAGRQFLDGLEQKNIVVKSDGRYLLEARFDRGKITLNGQPLGLQDFMKAE